MAQINSVLGPISTDDLGFTLMHEHVMASASGLYDSTADDGAFLSHRAGGQTAD